jgi:hypothetical protein
MLNEIISSEIESNELDEAKINESNETKSNETITVGYADIYCCRDSSYYTFEVDKSQEDELQRLIDEFDETGNLDALRDMINYKTKVTQYEYGDCEHQVCNVVC